ncbi:MAG: TetR/AcrR family transcriptional regulator [Peptococcaceae bacterium]|nr:TetR/AcrR family transcriptional regulator [Peptococcaceae bacterium]
MTFPKKNVLNFDKGGADSKSRILNTATSIFAEKGLDGARVDEIAEKAEINKRMIYHYFGNKENLYIEVLRTNLQKICDVSAEGYNPNDDFKINLKRVLERYFYFLAANEEFVRLINWEALNRGVYIDKLLSEFRNQYQESLNQLLETGIKSGILSQDLDIEQLMLSIDGLCLIYFSHNETFKRLWSKKSNSKEMLNKRIEHIYQLLMNGIILENKKQE